MKHGRHRPATHRSLLARAIVLVLFGASVVAFTQVAQAGETPSGGQNLASTGTAWTGYQVAETNPTNPGFHVSADFIVPRMDCSQDGIVSIWAGLGGVQYHENLAQAGVFLECRSKKQYAAPFYETVIQGRSYDKNKPFTGPKAVQPGDHVSVSVCGNNGYYPLKENPTGVIDGTPCIFRAGKPVSSVYMNVFVSRPGDAFSWGAAVAAPNDLRVAECIVERDQGSFPQRPLAKFTDPVQFYCDPTQDINPTTQSSNTRAANFQTPQKGLAVTKLTAAQAVYAGNRRLFFAQPVATASSVRTAKTRPTYDLDENIFSVTWQRYGPF